MIGNRDIGGPASVGNAFIGEMYQCGITVGASVSELHEWYRKYKTGNHTSIVAMQSGTLPDSALDSYA